MRGPVSAVAGALEDDILAGGITYQGTASVFIPFFCGTCTCILILPLTGPAHNSTVFSHRCSSVARHGGCMRAAWPQALDIW
jgi:hypothetical protein